MIADSFCGMSIYMCVIVCKPSCRFEIRSRFLNVAYGTNYRTACVPRVAAPCRNESQTRFLYEGVPHSVAQKTDLHTAQFCIPI